MNAAQDEDRREVEGGDRGNEYYEALLSRDPRYDGVVYYGIVTTGIFCRPVCSARKPRRENVRYFRSAKEAIDAGFRPCKLCAPLDPAGTVPEAYRELFAAAVDGGGRRLRDADIRGRGLDPEAVRRWWKRRYGVTYQAFSRSARLAAAFDSIRCGRTVTEAAFASGYGSLSGFGGASKAATGSSPSDAARRGSIWISRLETPLGTMVAGDFKGRLCLLEFADRRALETEIADLERLLGAASAPGRTELHGETERQLGEYFAGQRRAFELELELAGTEFQRTAWKALLSIPYGETRSYKDEAKAIGRPEAVRAVARANGQNRVAIVVPCHRVIGSDGSLTGYGGGLPRKRALLDIESGPPRPESAGQRRHGS